MFDDSDYQLYLDLLARYCRAADVSVWAWVLMPNHVHLTLTPRDSDGIRRALSRVHRLYAGHVHARLKRTGHFWQGRFGCVAMDEDHLGAALRYVALNPVRARYPDFAAHIAAGEDEELSTALRRAESIGRPLGDAAFLDRLEQLTGRSLRSAKRGPKPHRKK